MERDFGAVKALALFVLQDTFIPGVNGTEPHPVAWYGASALALSPL